MATKNIYDLKKIDLDIVSDEVISSGKPIGDSKILFQIDLTSVDNKIRGTRFIVYDIKKNKVIRKIGK